MSSHGLDRTMYSSIDSGRDDSWEKLAYQRETAFMVACINAAHVYHRTPFVIAKVARELYEEIMSCSLYGAEE